LKSTQKDGQRTRSRMRVVGQTKTSAETMR
jgi:hypothetical protein